MPNASIAATPYLDYLDKEMTIQGILSAFCIAVGAAAFDRILVAHNASELVTDLQSCSLPYVLGAIVALMTAAVFFYLQRSALAWLHGQISFAVTHRMLPRELPRDTNSIEEGLDIGNSWSIWNCYKFGITFLWVTAIEVTCALLFAMTKSCNKWLAWALTGGLFLAAIVVDVCQFRQMSRRDEEPPRAPERKVRKVMNIWTAPRKRRKVAPDN